MCKLDKGYYTKVHILVEWLDNFFHPINIGHGFIYNFKDPIHLYNFKSEYYIALQFYIKTSKVNSNVFDYISKVIVIVIITFL